MYTPKKSADWERSAAMLMSAEWHQGPEDGPVEVVVLSVAPRPKRLLRKKDPDGLVWKPNKPDGDNIIKCVFDALVMAGVIRDDAQVVKHELWDCYAERERGPRVEIVVRGVASLPLVPDGVFGTVPVWEGSDGRV
jgi:Holliday junction resolvase RusA-like endonuclease|tara:strand:+ start:2047 stop:2454 length:408 start_codon:yes stop_codon:yes gene_type:complete